MNNFTKKIIICLSIFSIIFSFTLNINALSPLSYSEAYASLVKINLFTLNNQGFLENISSDAGVIISSDGLVLTNYYDATSSKDFAYQICLNIEKNAEPECKYIARLITNDKEKNLSLLKIENISGLTYRQDFPYLKLSNSVNEAGNDLNILFYQNIDNKTLGKSFKTKINEKTNKYSFNWIKTNESFSFNDSLKFKIGIDKNGKLIAITNETYPDTKEDNNYLLEIISIEQWINNNEFKTSQISSLEYRMIDFIKKNINLSSSKTFNLNYPNFSINKPESFDFVYDSEDNLKMYNKVDKNGGFINISLLKFPYKVTNDDLDWIFKFDKLENLSSLNIIQKEDVKIDEKNGKRINFSILNEQKNAYYIPHEEFIIKIDYDYGDSLKDKDKVNKSISSLNFDNYASNPEYTDLLKINNHKLNIKNLIKEKEENIKSLNNEIKSNNETIIKDVTPTTTEDNFNESIAIWNNMKKQSIGILNRNLYKISIGIISDENELDSDNDGLADKLEKTLNLNPNNKDTDGDGYNDKLEIDNNYSPWGIGKQNIDYEFSENQKGKVFLQIEKNGELWYVNPLDNKRYYLSNTIDLLNLKRYLGLDDLN